MTETAKTRIDVREWITTLESIRQMRMQRHLAIAAVAALLIIFTPIIPDPMTELAAVVLLVGVLLQSLARGFNAEYGYMWGWIYAEPKRSTRLDQLVDRIVRRLRTSSVAGDVDPPAVRVLDPWES